MKKTIVFDFDNVIHVGYNGYKDGSIYGEIDYELLEFMKELLNNYTVVISSNRPAKQIVEFMNNLDTGLKFEEYDTLFWNTPYVVGVTNNKAVGILYIDDHGFRYENNLDTKENIKNIKEILENI